MLLGGSANKCDVNLTVKQAARGGHGEGGLGKGKGSGSCSSQPRALSQFLLPKPGLFLRPPKEAAPWVLSVMRAGAFLFQGSPSTLSKPLSPTLGREHLTGRAWNSSPSASFFFPGKPYGADDFLPVLMYVLARSNLTEMLLNVEYMMELMDPALQLGEGESPPPAHQVHCTPPTQPYHGHSSGPTSTSWIPDSR